MVHYKPKGKKARLAKHARQTRWAPFWLIPRIFGLGRKVHPSRITTIKRSWKRTRIED